MAAVVDHMGALLQVLIDDSTLNTLVGGRITAGQLNCTVNKSFPLKAVVLIPDGGGARAPGARDYMEHSRRRFSVRTYGENFREADLVMRTVEKIYRDLRRTVKVQVLLHSIAVAGGAIQLIDEDSLWRYYEKAFSLLAADIDAI